MSPRESRPPAPEAPSIHLEVVEQDAADAPGFLRLERRRYRARYPDGTASEPFPYDTVARRALDASVIVAHFAAEGARSVYLRSALRPPLIGRRARSDHEDRATTGALWEVPAGLVEPDESGPDGPRRSARRELLEEIGFDVPLEELRPLGPSTFPAPGIIAERHYYYEVEVRPASRGEPVLDGSALERFGRVLALPLRDALELCRAGEIEDAKTELALRRLQERYR